MRNERLILSAMSIAVASLCQMAPAFADDPLASKPDSSPPPMRVLGVVSGLLIGMPILAVRLSAKNYVDIRHEYAKDDPMWQVMGSVIALPVGGAKGVLQACYYGPKNAISNCTTKPFGKDAFGLGDLQ